MNSAAESGQALEAALLRTEAEADSSLKAAAAATRAVKRVRAVVHDGNLREVRSALEAAAQAVTALQAQVARAVDSWDFDDAGYLSSGGYVRELLETAERMRVSIFEQDDRLYCYPALVRVLSAERTVLIDRARERRLRPSLLVRQLRELQDRPPRFRPEAFLESLFKAYRTLTGRQSRDSAPVERLSRVYELLTLLPGQARDYSSHEFARDLYLLDRSGITETRDGFVVSFPSSTGTRASSGVILAITETGEERRYYGISFSRAE